jgi:SAM-dependent methyltransferase
MTDEEQIAKKQASRSFDRVALDYEQYRPTYPDSLIDRIQTRTPLPHDARILEVGSGTGKATELFVSRDYAVTCIEPGENLAAVAAEKFKGQPVEIVTTSFEDWLGEAETYDLIFSAQAWHWIDPKVGYAQAARLLKPTGSLALIWHMTPQQNSPVSAEIEEAYKRLAPGMAKDEDDTEAVIQKRIDEITNSGYFGEIATHRIRWSRRYTAAEHIGLLGTYSDHIALPENERERLYAALTEVIDRHGGSFERQYLTVLFLALKTAH